MHCRYSVLLASLCLCASVVHPSAVRSADEPPRIDTRRGDAMFAAYFAAETAKLAGRPLDDIETKEDWAAKKPELRRQLFEMLGLDPLPEKTPLHATTTGTIDHAEFTVENVHFQSRPQLYVTGNLYVPKGLKKPAPAILYVCGHGNVRKDGVSYGSKAHYQHHGAWFARHGYVCLVIDTLQLGEIEGLHHGTFHQGMYWWFSRGYTPAGVEAWNCIRALDYLQSRKEVDGERLGVTGRSGGGAYSWWIAALDERIKAAVPVAGITDLQNHVVRGLDKGLLDGVVEGHCDCMFMVNTYQWDYGTVAALVAPRPLLLTNTDDDRIFPLDGVQRIHWQLRKLYAMLGASKNLGLQISYGPHLDTQELQVAAMRWFNLHLKKEDPKIEIAAVRLFEPEQLKVFAELPKDQRNTTTHEWFVPTCAKPQVPRDASEWATMRDGWMKDLREKVFRGWPKEPEPLVVDESRYRARWSRAMQTAPPNSGPFSNVGAWVFFKATESIPLRLGLNSLIEREHSTSVRLIISHLEQPPNIGLGTATTPIAQISPRGAWDDTFWDQSPKKQTQHRRRFYLLGQTLEGQQVYDVRRAIQTLHTVSELKDAKVTLFADGPMAGVAIYAALFEPSVEKLVLTNLPTSHMPSGDDPKTFGPPLLNVLRYLDLPQAVALAAERATVEIHTDDADAWRYPVEVTKSLGWKDRVIVREMKNEN